jgi:amidase
MKTINDQVGALMDASCCIEGASSGPLQGLSFVLKDIYDVQGFSTGFGNPMWKSTHPIATHTNSETIKLLDAGASLVGKSHCDELTYNLFGNNFHYGTPINSASPTRMTGGSSNGSAAALSAGLVDFSIGSDTGGSVRAPASFCGLFGIRPTHGRISLDHACALAPSFDTFGWFANSAQLLLTIGEVLFQEKPSSEVNIQKMNFVYLKPAFDLIDPQIANLLRSNFSKFGSFQEVTIGDESLTEWAEQFRVLQGTEVWKNLGTWVSQHWDGLSAPIRARFEIAEQLTTVQQSHAQKRWPEIRLIMDQLLQANTILVLPTVAGIAPKLDAPLQVLETYRKQCFALLSTSGLCGTPQISAPLCSFDGAPLGISLMGRRGSDLQLLQIATALFKQ